MIKKILSFALVCLLLITANASLVSAQTNNNEALAAIIKTAVAARGTGENKRVEVSKKDGTKLKGYVSQSDEDSFTLVDSKSKQNVELAYADVAKIKIVHQKATKSRSPSSSARRQPPELFLPVFLSGVVKTKAVVDSRGNRD